MGARTLNVWIMRFGDIDFMVAEKTVRRFTMRIDRRTGRPSVTVPAGFSRADLQAFVENNYEWARKAMMRFEEATHKERELTPELCRKAFIRISELVPLWAARMNVRPGRIRMRMMTSRWGSCNPRTGNLTFNYRLAAYPDECIEYVVIHELAHLVYADHSGEFWEFVSRFCPDYKRCRYLMR